MEQDEVMEVFRAHGAILDGHFLLSSGKHSPQYLQCALVLSDPADSERLCRDLAGPWRDKGVTAVVGPAMGGIVIAYELARALGVRGIFAERADGEMALRRGFAVSAADNVLVAEDVVTTGGSVKEVIRLIRSHGARVAGVASLVMRATEAVFDVDHRWLLEISPPVYERELCPQCAAGSDAVKPGSRPGVV